MEGETNLTIKETLRQARNIDRRINETQERLQRLHARLEAGKRTNYSELPRGGARNDWTEVVDQAMALEGRLNRQIAEMYALKHLAMTMIESVPDTLMREVLELYYLDGVGWGYVARRIGADKRQVYRLHGKALLMIQRFWGQNGTKVHK